MTIQFTGTLRYRFRLSILGHDIFAGAWQTQSLNIRETVPSEAVSIPLIDSFTASVGEAAGDSSLAVHWEGLPLLSDTIPLNGSLPISLQPLKGIILAGTASIVG